MQIVHQENHEKDWHKLKESQPHKSSNLKHQTQNNYIHHLVHQQSHTRSYSPVSLFHDWPSNIIWDHPPPLVAFLRQALEYHKWRKKVAGKIEQHQTETGMYPKAEAKGHF